MEQRILQLENEVRELRKMLDYKDTNYELRVVIQDVIFRDIDNTTTATRVATDSNGDTVTVPKNPSRFLRVEFRGKTYNIAAYDIS